MKKLFVLMFAFVMVSCFTVSVQATIIDFDDLPNETSQGAIGDSYMGFDWNNGETTINYVTGRNLPTSGYEGLDPYGNVAWGYGYDLQQWMDLIGSGTFTLNTIDWRSAWDEIQTIQLYGKNNGSTLYSYSFTAFSSMTTTTNLNWSGIDSLWISASGTSQWTMDNIVINNQPIPEPTTVALLGIGLAGLAGGAVRRRLKKTKQ